MTLGPIISRELLVAARSPRTYSTRALLVFGFLAGFCAVYEGYRIFYGRQLSIQIIASMARQTFLMAAAIQGVATLMIVPQLVCGAIAREKDGKTLGFLLGTPLGSAEIVLAKLASRLFRYFVSMIAAAPAIFLLILLGGIEPSAIVLLYVATASTAITIGSFAILTSVLCRGTKQATQFTALFVSLWNFLPFVMATLGMVMPLGVFARIYPAVEWVGASTPLFFARSVFSILVRGGRGIDWTGGVLLMVLLQAGLTATFLSLAIWRLRPSYRDQEGNSRRTVFQRLRAWRWRFLKKPPVGDSPIYWRETSTSTTQGVAKLLGSFFALSIAGIVAYHAVRFAYPAIRETLGSGYGGGGFATLHFNLYVRWISAALVPFLLAYVSGAIAASVAAEKERDTWLGLIATPLSGREILGAKRLAPLHSIRFAVLGLAILWLLGLASGALHLLGLLLATLLVASWTILAIGLGTWFSTRGPISGNTSGSAAGLLLLLWVVPPLVNAYEPFRSMVTVATCLPWLVWLSLGSYPDAWNVLHAGGSSVDSFPGLIRGSAGIVALIAFAFGLFVPAVAGWLLIRHADATFDRLADRPIRPTMAP